MTIQSSHPKSREPDSSRRRQRSNMHEGIAVWCDCCTCEAEPHWAALAEEMGIDLNDREDEERLDNG